MLTYFLLKNGYKHKCCIYIFCSLCVKPFKTSLISLNFTDFQATKHNTSCHFRNDIGAMTWKACCIKFGRFDNSCDWTWFCYFSNQSTRIVLKLKVNSALICQTITFTPIVWSQSNVSTAWVRCWQT